ncbi:membrane protein DedA with SNARE-associated domain [Rhodothalassium salexigens DSM 2132]|uniref:Membrane protein DedA with SNARE-associated domain n=1 Tax=Rhodothalassium salexigens DSM 2132 TaxID=1188247 RepID=A0A4R2PB33_RHOSA|nr:VTT domain-containing protein [Rhodothalassium salexigens]MBB4212454.1 membrane protein DedA with SNARE-associated domain [Rhodothalassium salexigens DSM 2132]MBK1639935.1 hypothetical protein [Rhodothalassium salexigens DSM 2132]TCP31504.1 membrane protein DedA with SNARE-associated domain [Rhodothalassium salexigens DSM 2132]
MALLISLSDLMDALQALAGDPMVLWWTLMAATLVSEDAAIVGAALLAAHGTADIGLAYSAVNVGVVVGDTGLYLIGYAASRYRQLRALVTTREVFRAKRFLRRQLIPILLSTRFLPGSRLPTYTACGFFRFPLSLFAIVLTLASLTWTVIVFVVIHTAGLAILEWLGPWKWLGVVLLIGVFFVVPRLVGPRLARRFGVVGRSETPSS